MTLIALLAAAATVAAPAPADTPFSFTFQQPGAVEAGWTEPAMMLLTRIDDDSIRQFFQLRGSRLAEDPLIRSQPWLEADWVEMERPGAAGRIFDLCSGQVAVRPVGMPANDDLVTTDLAAAQGKDPRRFERYVFLITMTSYVCGGLFDSTGIGGEARGVAAGRLGLDSCKAQPIDALLNRLARKPEERARTDLVELIADGLVDSGDCAGTKNQGS